VRVSSALDATGWDLVRVTVLASQVDAVLPALVASAAKTVMFMFNIFDPLRRLRDAVGPSRFAFGFPAILASGSRCASMRRCERSMRCSTQRWRLTCRDSR
jgi:2-dehydropantoate 2-reductase